MIKEFETLSYFAVHHLSVLAYLLQHNEYSRRGWLEARRLLGDCLERNLTSHDVRREVRPLSGGPRNWSLIRRPRLAGVEALTWTRTVADIRLDTAEDYCDDVRAWADSVLIDTEAFVRSLVPDAERTR